MKIIKNKATGRILAGEFVGETFEYDRMHLNKSELECFKNAGFESLDLSYTKFIGTHYYTDNFKLIGSKFDNAELKWAVFAYLDASGTSFEDANLYNAKLYRSRFIEANFKNANLCRSNLRLSCFKDANFEGANLRGAKILLARFKGANISGARMSLFMRIILLIKGARHIR